MSCSISFTLKDGTTAVDLECPNTWPDSLKLALTESDCAKADHILAAESILGFHCTKLLPHEREEILRNGLRPLTAELAEWRICKAVQFGYLRQSVADALLHENEAGDESRRGKVWFVNARSLLKRESGIYRLFHFWGGEAIYGWHESDCARGPALSAIGEPCLVVAGIHGDRIEAYGSLGQHFLNRFIGDADSAAFESHVNETVRSEWVIDILGCSDRRFEALTKYSTWTR